MVRGKFLGRLYALLGLILVIITSNISQAQPVSVRVVRDSGVWRMERDGRPYVIRGAGGQVELPLMVQCGAN
ncbi:MAG: hypothetical protein ACKODJ_09945, partial [Bacteroidota bacterium]